MYADEEPNYPDGPIPITIYALVNYQSANQE